MTRDEFKKLYPEDLFGDKPYSKLIEINMHDDHVEYIEYIDLTHPDCPIIVFKGL